jgi:hypothetical protein
MPIIDQPMGTDFQTKLPEITRLFANSKSPYLTNPLDKHGTVQAMGEARLIMCCLLPGIDLESIL